ncbi:uncharacterized protein LOC133189428 [Saccostrea echinata]|uniref:uncharacterized protein LOC133189428 n=1 Tax=Saccostrea echinata TaxID=191078 RepID=UPI002A834722|nr:uncharacterized protein LOC133189428 [Saccostrea echinata]
MSTIKEMKELLEIGTQMGLKDAELQQFVNNEQARLRDEREKDRAERMAKQERDFQLELEIKREQNAEAEHKRKIEEMEIDHKFQVLAAERSQKVLESTALHHPETQQPVRGPKLPAFDEAKDNIDAYIQRFERYAISQKWQRTNWGAHLSALLKGKALDVFARLPPDSALDFDELKKALMKRFDMTEDGFRKKFRSSKPDGSETFLQFSTRIESYLERWMELAKTNKTYEGLKDLMLREQFILCCNKELSLFLKERIPPSIQDMARYADQFVEARATSSSAVTQRPIFEKKVSIGKQFSFPSTSDSSKPSGGVKCFNCDKYGHKQFDCPLRKSSATKTANTLEKSDRPQKPSRYSEQQQSFNRSGRRFSQGKEHDSSFVGAHKPWLQSDISDIDSVSSGVMPVVKGCVGDRLVTVLRDTGCRGAVIRKSLVTSNQMTGKTHKCMLADGSIIDADVAIVEVDTPYFTGTIEVSCFETPMFDLILGNFDGVRKPDNPDIHWMKSTKPSFAVETRSQLKKKQLPYKPLRVPETLQDVSRDEMLSEQLRDDSLSKSWDFAKQGTVKELGDGGSTRMYIRKQLLYREFSSPKVSNGKTYRQLMVPKKYRSLVMKMAHECLMAGHLGVKKTTDRILAEFFWPGVQADVRRFCRSCDVCQRTIPKGKVPAVPLGQMPMISEPFQRIAVDIVGPLQPITDRGNRYILTIIDYATRYPEAVALHGIETERVAEALVDVFSRVGIPSEMLTDQGSQFTSEVMKEVSRLLSLKRLTTTPYHPMCNGLVEKFNGTLKQMLKRMCAERPKDWDKYLNALLFAYREIPQESLGFSPFELLYGRSVRGPMMILKELWTKDIPDKEVKTTYQYILDLKEKLEETCKIAHQQLEKARKYQRKHYNKRTIDRRMKVGDLVLVLLPTKSNKLLMQWRGPYKVVQKVGDMDYKVEMHGKLKTLHANLLKKYIPREEIRCGVLTTCAISLIDFSEEGTPDEQNLMMLPTDSQTETVSDVRFNEGLDANKLESVKCLCESYADVLTDVPGMTTLVKHKIELTSSDPIRVKQYPIPFNTESVIKEEVEKMLQLNVIEPSVSPYSSPVVIARKKDGTNRFCIDFRRLNSVTVFDAEPMPNTESIFSKMAGKKYVSKLDLSKGYWQVPMEDESKVLTAFSTPSGLYQFRTMPFGLVNAPATFSRLMRKLLQGMVGVDNFIDDIIVYTDTWEEHLMALRELFTRLRKAGLTARPSKCFIGYDQIDCLGHVVGDQRLKPESNKIEAIRSAPVPMTKKQVRSFLGLAGFYRKFIPNFSAIAAPLSDLTKKGQPNKVVWTDNQQRAFDTLKQMLCSEPILKLPDFSEVFILRTDAADDGLGAVLLQEEHGEKLPVAYRRNA